MGEVYQSLVAVEPFTLVVTILNLFLQMYLIKKFLLDKVKTVLQQRREAALSEMAEAESAREEALAMKAHCEADMERAEEAAEALLDRARKQGAEESQRLLEEARQQVAQLKEKTQTDLARQQKKAINDAKNELSELAMALAAKVVGRNLGNEDRRLADQFVEELGDG